MSRCKSKSRVPVILWYLVAFAFLGVGALNLLLGAKLTLATGVSPIHLKLGLGLLVLGLVLSAWGFVILWRCLR